MNKLNSLVRTTLLALSCTLLLGSCKNQQQATEVVQLNWFHDPTFAGEYRLAQQRDIKITVKEGGTSVQPLAELTSGRATYAVMGADLFIEFIDKSLKQHETPNIQVIFTDLQRNPVGWVLHPDAAAELGLPAGTLSQKDLNDWAASKIKDGSLRVGDKRGTETTSIWVQWKKLKNIPDSVHVEPVGFDPRLVLSAPKLLYPVYLNEEPYKLREAIGRDLIVFDPASDGVAMYGNLVVCRRDFAEQNRDRIKTVQQSLRSAWTAVRSDIPGSAQMVATFYKGVSDTIIRAQLSTTTEFVFYENKAAGAIDMDPDGRLARTLRALHEAGLVSTDLSFSVLSSYASPPD